MVTHCEIIGTTGLRCEAIATSWCRACDRAVCEPHWVAAVGVAAVGVAAVEGAACTGCAASEFDASTTFRAPSATTSHQDALADITDSIRALRARNCAGTELAYRRTVRRVWWRPWTLHSRAVYSIRYWPVGTFTWVQSCPGGFGEHELVLLGLGEFETVVNERGQITRRDEQEIVSGRAVLAQLLSAPSATVSIAATLRGYLD